MEFPRCCFFKSLTYFTKNCGLCLKTLIFYICPVIMENNRLAAFLIALAFDIQIRSCPCILADFWHGERTSMKPDIEVFLFGCDKECPGISNLSEVANVGSRVPVNLRILKKAHNARGRCIEMPGKMNWNDSFIFLYF